jgi:hypothetical protein
MAASIVGAVAIIPFSLSLLEQMEGQMVLPPNVPKEVFWTIVFAVQVVVEIVFSALALAVGLGLGRRVGLGAPLLAGVLAGEPEAGRRLRRAWTIAALVGLVMGAVVVAAAAIGGELLPDPAKEIVHPAAWQGFLASIGAGIREELWLRMGLLTLFAWIPTRLMGTPRPGLIILWTANLLATLPFGAMHLPQAAGLFGELTPGMVFYVLSLNGTVGLVCGWLYWRWGITASMMAHFSADIVLHVIAPAL